MAVACVIRVSKADFEEFLEFERVVFSVTYRQVERTSNPNPVGDANLLKKPRRVRALLRWRQATKSPTARANRRSGSSGRCG